MSPVEIARLYEAAEDMHPAERLLVTTALADPELREDLIDFLVAAPGPRGILLNAMPTVAVMDIAGANDSA